jgi:hypothetical protein
VQTLPFDFEGDERRLLFEIDSFQIPVIVGNWDKKNPASKISYEQFNEIVFKVKYDSKGELVSSERQGPYE